METASLLLPDAGFGGEEKLIRYLAHLKYGKPCSKHKKEEDKTEKHIVILKS